MIIKVDRINGIDHENNDNDNHYSEDVSYTSLGKAIEVSESGDTIHIMPGSYDPIQIVSKTKPFELTVKGSGIQTVAYKCIFEGMFDFYFKALKFENINISSTNSNFKFRKSTFTARNEIVLNGYHNTDIITDNPKTYIIFENCVFDTNFQIKVLCGSYIISLKNCEIRNSTIPLIFVKRGDVTLRVSNTDFDYPLLKNQNGVVEIQHTCCNFTCSLYLGKEVLIYTKDNLIGSTPQIEQQSQFSFIKQFSIDNNEEDYNKSEALTDREFYGAITLDTSKMSPKLKLHKYTKIVRIKGKHSALLTLPDSSEVPNGHCIKIFCEVPYVEINGDKYSMKNFEIYWIYGDGWFFAK